MDILLYERLFEYPWVLYLLMLQRKLKSIEKIIKKKK